MTKAFFAAATAAGLSYQKPISRYDANPTNAQPTMRKKKLPASTSSSIENTNRFMLAKNRR